MTTSLNPRQHRFASEYVKDLNGTKAAIRAGYSDKGADVQACRLLGDVRIQAAIVRLQQKRADEDAMDNRWVRDHIAKVIERCMSEDDFRDSGALKGLELIGRHNGMFEEAPTAGVSFQIQINIGGASNGSESSSAS